MVAAILKLSASLRKGIYCEHVEPDTARKTLAWYGNTYDAGAGYVGLSIWARIIFLRTRTPLESGTAGWQKE